MKSFPLVLLAFLSSFCVKARPAEGRYPVQWASLNKMEVSGSTLQTKSGEAWGSAMSGRNLYPAAEPLILEYTFHTGGSNRAFGFNDPTNDSNPVNFMGALINLDYGFYFDAEKKTMWALLPGNKWNSMADPAVEGSVFKLIVNTESDQVSYLIDGKVVYDLKDQKPGKLKIMAALPANGAISNILSNVNLLSVAWAKEHATTENTHSGIIALAVSGGKAPYQYTWSSPGLTGNVQNNLSPGTYTIVVSDADFDTSIVVTDILLKNTWRLQKDISVRDDRYTQTSTSSSSGGLLLSHNIIPAGVSGMCEVTIDDSTNFTAFGFLGFNEASTDYTAPYIEREWVDLHASYLNELLMTDAIYLPAEAKTSASYGKMHQVYFVEGKVKIGFKTYTNSNEHPMTYKSGDVFKLQRIGNGITLYKNGVAVANEVFSDIANQHLLTTVYVTKRTSKIRTVGSLAQSPNFVELSAIPLELCDEPVLNWVRSRTFDENGTIKSDSKTYMDMLGRSIQSQSKVLSDENVLVSEPLYDSYGRAVGQSLPAPSFKSTICYVPNFIENEDKAKYTCEDFDYPLGQGPGNVIDDFNVWGDVNNPKPVSVTVQGKLGWYYSDANTAENLVAADELPYARSEFYEDGRLRRAAGVGTNLKMGSGHETKFIYISTPPVSADPTSNELNYVFPYRTYELEKDFAVRLHDVNLNLQLFKTISINPDGKDQISYTNSGGQTIATCITGDGTGCVTHKEVKQLYPAIASERIQYIYIPKGKNNSFRFLELDVYGEPAAVPTQAVPVLKDVNHNTTLTNGTDYTFDAATGYITFYGNYSNRSLYLQVTYSSATTPANQLVATAETDYSQWTLYFYDRKGRLLANASPEEVLCQPAPKLFKKEVISAGSPNILRNAPVTIPFKFTEAENDKALVFITITPTSSAISSLSGVSSFSFRSEAEKRAIDSLYFILNPVLTDSTVVLRTIDNSYINVVNIPGPESIAFENLLDSVETKVPANGLAGKRIIYRGKYAIYKKFTGNPNEIPLITIPYAFMIEAKKDPANPLSTLTTITPVMERIGPVRLELMEASAIEGLAIRVEGSTISTEGFGIGDLRDADLSTQTPYMPFDLQPLINSLDQAVGVGIDVDISNIPVPLTIPMANRYMYDEYDRLVGSENEDQGKVFYVYDQLEDKLLFTQNDKQYNAGGKFSCIVYDKLGRPEVSGEYDPMNGGPTSGGMPYEFQNYYDHKNGVPVQPGRISTGVPAYANSSDYNDGHIFERTFMEYDHADHQLPANTNSFYEQRYTAAKVSKTYNDQSTTWYSYDELGRQTWSVQKSTELGYKTMNYAYDMRGKLLASAYQIGETDNIVHSYSYDADERLKAAYYAVAGNGVQPLARYSYYLHGPLKRSLLGDNLQGLDYIYTIDGKLKSVNNPVSNQTDLDPGLDGYSTGPNAAVSPDAFSFALEYYNNDYYRAGSPVSSYNYVSAYNDDNMSYAGLIKAVSWRTALPLAAGNHYADALMYEYNYDEQYRLTGAQFGTVSESGGPLKYHNFSTLPEYKLEGINYDKNGNLQTLKRYAEDLGGGSAHLMDDFTYKYDGTKKNKLRVIEDGASNTAGYSTDIDMPHQNNSVNYVYNEIGELIINAEEKKGFEYNAQGLVKRVFNLGNNADIATFTYNDKGLRHSKKSYDANGNALQNTYYSYDAGGLQVASYTEDLTTPDPAIILQDLHLYGAGRVGIYNMASATALYELTDHLGNVRAVVKDNGHRQAETVSYTDYYPHGSIMPGRNYQSSLNFPYGYQGQEKDAETGLTNFELRQYDGRIGRWYNPDPMGQHHSPYLAMSNNPVSSVDPDGGWDGEMNGESANSNANYFISMAESTQGRLYGDLSQLERKFVANYNHKTYQKQFEDRIMDNVDDFGSYSERGKDYYFSEKRGVYGYWADYVEKTSFRSGKVGYGHDGKAFEAATLGTNVGWKFHRIGGDEFNTNIRLKLQLQNDLMSGLKTVEGFNPASNLWDAASMLTLGTDKYGNEGSAIGFAYAAIGAIPGGNVEAAVAKSEFSTIYRAVSQGELDDIMKNGIRDIGGANTYSGGKLFTFSESEAMKYGKINFGFDRAPQTIIKVKVPTHVLNNAYKFEADLMRAVEIPSDQLHLLQATPLNYSPLH